MTTPDGAAVPGEVATAAAEDPAAATARSALDLDAAWTIHPQVEIRPEPFGALLYHFGTRKLSFLKNRTILTILRSLPDHPSARSAMIAADVAPESMGTYARALRTLADSRMIVRSPE
ncbi:mycofactocin biosynthesis chaperone MftB [Millisia brevis]|uniref:mycofactocin biosynthesis chaperone MftB n=1 Tax=Millisia brevis TaxID=264148 RepID=UPI00082D9CBA|nr:mycofactocin biosynthesis chaperone MftB [Millisia brevis]